MPPDPSRCFRPRMTLRQFGVFVIFAAITLAVVTPIGRSASGARDFVLLTLFELPYVLLVPILALVRRGPLKNWMAAFVCGVPLATLLVYAGWLAISSYLAGNSPAVLIAASIPGVMLLVVLNYLGRWAIPRRCPTCGRPAMLIDPSIPRSRDFPGRYSARTCLACGGRFRRLRGGPWVDVDALPPRPNPLAPIPSRR